MLFSKYLFSSSLFFIDFSPEVFIFFSEELPYSTYFVLFLIIFLYQTGYLTLSIYLLNKPLHSVFKNNSSLYLVYNNSYLRCLLSVTFLFNFAVLFSLKGCDSMIWYSHLLVSYSQIKVAYLIIFFTIAVLLILITESLSLSLDKLDFYLSTINIYLWLFLLFFCTNMFTFIFFLEILSISTMLINASSINYSKQSLTYNNFSNNLTSFLNIPYYKINSLLIYFWISFFASVNLFLFFYFYLYYFLTTDQSLLEIIMSYEKINWSITSSLPYVFTWYVILSAVFIKCGLVPFYAWKPQFFKGLSFSFILFYNVVYYFFLLIFILFFIFSNCNAVTSLFLFLNLTILISGLFLLLTILYSVSYLKSFISFSSILNTLLVLTLLSCSSYEPLYSF